MNIDKLASVGALAVTGGSVVLYAGALWLTSTTPIAGVIGATGGVDAITRNVLAICLLVPIAIMAAAHFVFFRQLKKGASSLNDSPI
jgi:hypothetical protein